MDWFIAECYRFLHMGGYAWFVWPAYGIAFVILGFNIYLPLKKHKQLLSKLMSPNNDNSNEDFDAPAA